MFNSTMTKEGRAGFSGMVSTVVKGVNADGTPKVTGGSALKVTQSYTHEYGELVAKFHLTNRETRGPPAFNATALCLELFESVSWDDCEFDGLKDLLARGGF